MKRMILGSALALALMPAIGYAEQPSAAPPSAVGTGTGAGDDGAAGSSVNVPEWALIGGGLVATAIGVAVIAGGDGGGHHSGTTTTTTTTGGNP